MVEPPSHKIRGLGSSQQIERVSLTSRFWQASTQRAAQDALIGVGTVEGIGVIDLVRLGLEWQFLMFDGHHLRGVVDHAIAVVVVADRAQARTSSPSTSTMHVSQVWIEPSCG